MEFVRIKSTVYSATGQKGIFEIRKSNNNWWASYYGSSYFKFPPKKTLTEAKELCKSNFYWEDPPVTPITDEKPAPKEKQQKENEQMKLKV